MREGWGPEELPGRYDEEPWVLFDPVEDHFNAMLLCVCDEGRQSVLGNWPSVPELRDTEKQSGKHGDATAHVPHTEHGLPVCPFSSQYSRASTGFSWTWQSGHQ